jgi:poly(glycerol-phosphate) alpha-glucosyltransferase
LGIKAPIVKIGNGVDLPELASNQANNAAANDGVRTLLYLGRLHPIKNVDKLIAAWRSAGVNQLGKAPWRLQIVGWGQDDYVASLKELARDENSIAFSGPLFGDDKDLAMNQASGFILPSSSEAFPMALMEAWSHALPAVATNTCNVLGEAGSSVSLFVDGAEHDIARGIQSFIIMTDKQRQTLGDNARAIVAKDYSWEQVSRNLLACYHWILGTGPEPAYLMCD